MAPISCGFNAQLVPGQLVQAFPLTQPYRHPILVEQVQFAFGPSTVTSRSLLHQINFGIKFGAAEAVLDRTAPLQAFCRRAGFYDGIAGSTVETGPYNNTGGTRFSGLQPRSWLAWTLPDPVFVPEKGQIECLLNYALNIPNPNDASLIANFNIWVVLTGQALPKMEPWPELVRIPWISAHRTPARAISVGAVDAHTPEHSLQNQNEEPVVVQRMLGSCATQYVSDELIDADVRVSDTTGAYIVRERTPMMELFNGRTRCWDMGVVLKPKEFISVEYAYDPTNMVGNATSPVAYATSDEIQLIFGLVGYRELPTAAVYPKVLVPATGQPPVLRPTILPQGARSPMLPGATLAGRRR